MMITAKRMRWLAMAVVAASLMLSQVGSIYGQDEISRSSKTTLTIIGADDCGQWLDARKTNEGRGYEWFVQGTLDGMSIGSGKEYWETDGRKISLQAAYSSVDLYCRNHPTDMLLTAISHVFVERAK